MLRACTAKVLTVSSKLHIYCSKVDVENSKEHVADAKTVAGNAMQ